MNARNTKRKGKRIKGTSALIRIQNHILNIPFCILSFKLKNFRGLPLLLKSKVPFQEKKEGVTLPNKKNYFPDLSEDAIRKISLVEKIKF